MQWHTGLSGGSAFIASLTRRQHSSSFSSREGSQDEKAGCGSQENVVVFVHADSSSLEHEDDGDYDAGCNINRTTLHLIYFSRVADIDEILSLPPPPTEPTGPSLEHQGCAVEQVGDGPVQFCPTEDIKHTCRWEKGKRNSFKEDETVLELPSTILGCF